MNTGAQKAAAYTAHIHRMARIKERREDDLVVRIALKVMEFIKDDEAYSNAQMWLDERIDCLITAG